MQIGSSRTPLIPESESESEPEPTSMRSSSSSSPADPAPENSRLIFVSDPDLTHRESNPSPNTIRTTKYSLLTFIPRNLFEQFRRVAYIYFLALALLNQVPQLTVFGRETAFVPLGVVLLATAVKDGYEDYRRHRSDKVENRRVASIFSSSSRSFVSVPWKHVRAGDIVRVVADEGISCDLALLSTSDPTGAAFVQTLNLDGESNLKTRYALQETLDRGAESWVGDGREPAVIRCEMPNLNIYGFQATIEIDGRKIPLGPNNVVLRGCEIKNTEWIIGVAVYTGMETKVMLNCSGAPSKRSRLETRMNREILMLAGTMILLCTVVATCTGVWLHQNRDKLDTLPFYRKRDFSERTEKNYLYSGLGLEILIAFVKSIFSFQNFIPISLYISMEIARVTQSYMMTQDKNMYHEATDTKFQCRALNINEDLGQIKYVFSDKTGTLTENKMVFQCASVDGVDYSCAEELVAGQVAPHPAVVDGQVWRPKMVVNTDPQLMHLLETGKGTEEWMHVYYFFIVLAACNTIVPQVTETSEPTVKLIEYQGESPDEQALVYAAAAYGFVLIERSSGHIVIDVLGERQRFTLLGLHEFDSDRKRMSVIVGCGDQTIKLFVKGADNAMRNVIDKTVDLDKIRATETHLHKYSSLGLRTLVIGMRELSTVEFEEWQLAYNNAGSLLAERAESLLAVALKIECNLHILGASGIEDKLQQGVPEAIESLRQAGIKAWVLTGDKQETAISIGYSCKLLTDDMTQIIINSDSKESCKSALEDAISTSEKVIATSLETENIKGDMESQRVPLALIIDGPTLVFILETELEEELYKLATACDVVLCCRVAPLQKAGIVSLMKKRTSDMTLSIGDGANDVSMIQMADVGIGISGQEGRQAVMASDFSMGQFRFLVPLLLVHGHWNYQRLAYMILYNYYRNAVYVFILYWYMFFSDVSLFNPINDTNGLLYSAVYTALPTIIVGIYDQNLSSETLLKYPKLYGAGLRDESYNFKLFFLFMADSIWQSLVIVLAPFLTYGRFLDDSTLGDIWILTVVILVNVHLAMDIVRWNWAMHAVIWGLTILTFCCVIAIESSPVTPGYRAALHALGSKTFWLLLLMIMALAFLPRALVKTCSEYFRPSDIRIAREIENFGNPNEVRSQVAENPSTDHRSL